MPTLRFVIFTFSLLIVCIAAVDRASAQTVRITSGSELGNLSGQTIYQNITAGTELRAVVANGTGTYQWTFTGSPQVIAGSLTARAVTVKWAARGSYTASVSYNGTAALSVNVVVTDEQDDVALTPRPCSDEPQMRSITAEVPTFINFKNTTNKTIKIFWLNYSNPGQRVLYSTVAAGTSYYQQMWMTQPWVVTDENDNCLGIYEPIRQMGRATIINVKKVEFETILQDSEPLSLNPNAGGGRRFYPDKINPGEAAIRNQIRVKATLSEYLQNQKIYFRSFDVDDPSANTAPIDDDSGTNANAETIMERSTALKPDNSIRPLRPFAQRTQRQIFGAVRLMPAAWRLSISLLR